MKENTATVAPLLAQLVHQVLDALLAPALELEQVRGLQVKHIGRRVDQARLDQLQDELLAQAFDLEGATSAQERGSPDELRQRLNYLVLQKRRRSDERLDAPEAV